jgi:xanthine dehydrogenase YagS FAD-binding subunit
MKTFNHHHAKSIEEAVALLKKYKGKARLNAGGSDLLGLLKDSVLPHYPELIINIKTLPGLDTIREEGERLRIGALVKLADIARSAMLRKDYPLLSEAARAVASPQIRNIATLGGNLCQEVRCWYYRYPSHLGGAMDCARKGKGPCFAVKGDNRYHAVIDAKKCFAVCPSDLAVALMALDASMTIVSPRGERRVAVGNFYHSLGNALEKDEMVMEIDLPRAMGLRQQRFIKFTLRKPIDFAVVSAASVMAVQEGVCTDARIILGAVAPGPFRAKRTEDMLTGRPLNDQLAEAAAEAALEGAKPLSKNAFKIEIAKALVRRAIMGDGNPSSISCGQTP